MILSVLTYAVFSGACGLSTNVWQMAGLRFVASLGMGGEWSLGVALVMEVWPDRSRAWLAGVVGAAGNFGYMAIALIALALTGVKDLSGTIAALGVGTETATWLGANSGWRVLMLVGVLPAILTVFIQLFVPESGRWEAEKRRGATSHWQTRDLLGVLIGAAAGCVIIALWAAEDLSLGVRVAGSLAALIVVTAGYLYPIVRFVQRAEASDAGRDEAPGTAVRAVIARLLLAAALSGVALLGTWGSTQFAPTYADKLTGGTVPEAKAYTQALSALGAVIGCVGAALAGGWLGRRVTYALLCVASMVSIAGLYQLNDSYGLGYLCWAFAAGTITAAFYGWLPLYLPELFRTKVRATGQGFGYNFGRIIAAVGVLQLPTVMAQLQVGWQGACTAMSAVYLVGLGLIWLAPETKGRPLPT
jgi:MFS family permease